MRLGQSLNAVHFLSGYPVEPVDLHHGVRHLWASYDALTLMDKAVHCYSLGRQRNIDVLEMVRIARGVDQATIDREPSVFTVVNSSSPLRLDAPMLQGIMEFAAHNQVVCITPFTLAGAMAPVTLAGALAEQNAEALAGMVLTQAVNPGAPVIYGGFTSNVDMQSGAPAFGTPEYMRTAMIGGQLARRYGVPYRSSNVNAANALDAQAAYESVFSLWGAIQGGVNLLMHGAGWMEGGLHASYEKMILDAELLGMVAAFLEPVVVDDETLAFSAMQEVGPGGHFFGAEHTQSRYKTAFHKPMLSDWRNYETWEEAGSPELPVEGEPDLEGAAGGLRAAADGSGHPRGARRVRRAPGRRGRRPDRLLKPHRARGSVKTETQVVVIGGGVVGASVLYHLTKAGWTDVMLLERRELTAGSTWHAAGGMHTLNGDPNVSKLQQYTIQLYEEIERISGQDCSIHLPGGLMLADTEVRMDFLRMAVARGRYLGMDLELISAKEAQDLFPLIDPQYFVGALYDPVEGHVDPSGVTRAYVKSAQLAGAEVHQHTPVVGLEQRPDGTWDVRVESGDAIHTEHVVNAGGLWAREVGRMVGLELPVLAMEHQYLLTVDMPEVAEHVAKTGHEMPMTLDFGGEIYLRQEGGGMLLGTYEQACVPWSPRETPWDFGSQLLKPDLDRITPELQVAFKHYPAMATTGIKRVVNGPFTFSPDGNPLVGPIRGLRGYWVACGVMAGLSQGGGVGLALATWMTAGDHGDSGMDIWAMDVARYGDYATLAYTNAKVQENYRRRFRITFPNEELPDARPLLTTPIHDRLTTRTRSGARPSAWSTPSGSRSRGSSRRRTSPSGDRTRGRRSRARSPRSANGSA